MHPESKRHADNQRTLLENVPEMVLLATADGSVEYMNPSAIPFVRQTEEQLGSRELSSQIAGVLRTLLSDNKEGKPKEYLINNRSFVCRYASFEGYDGDKMYWLILCSPETFIPVTREPVLEVEGEGVIVGSSKIMHDLQNMVKRVSKADTGVLISGESGVGKELIANAIFRDSQRNKKPFLTINCNTISDLLLESDLFGHEKGSFTGAHVQKKGKFEAVDGGTIFLDEIGDISNRMQGSLLRVLEQGEIIRVGGTAPINIDVRVIAATNCDLVQAVENGKFRLDLFYRLNIINIKVPPLRQRKEDLPELVIHFFEKYSKVFSRKMEYNLEAVVDKLGEYHWPGNIRELSNVIQRAILLSASGTITGEDLIFDMPDIVERRSNPLTSSLVGKLSDEPLKWIVDQVEKEVIVHKLESSRGNVAETAGLLNISKAALYEKMKKYDISAKALR